MMTPPPPSPSRRVGGTALLGSLLLLVTLLPVARGTITVMDTGERFPSRQDSQYGPLLWKGYQYAGRLQRIEGNLPLCPPTADDGDDDDDETPPQKVRLAVPSDGLPVALLGRKGTCSTLDKLNYIRNHVEPANLVHYLILDGDHRHHGVVGTEGMMDEPSATVVGAQGPLAFNTVTGERSLRESSSSSSKRLCTTKDCLKKRDESIPIHVLHVSVRTEYKLLDYLMHQSETSETDGGPRLAIDSKVNVHRLSDNVALAVAAVTLLAACLCSLGLLIHGNRSGWWEPGDPPAGPPQQPRRNRRRLRREQVKELLPVYRFNGTELEIIPEEQEADEAATVDEEGEPRPRVPPLLSADMDCCSICLDEYEVGDRVRCIDPCNHTFHSKCIGKWLVERSATCPLCKFDLYDSDEEEEEEETQAEQQQQQGTTNQINPRGLGMNADPENPGITRFEAQPPPDFLEGEPQEGRSFWPFTWGGATEETPPAALEVQQGEQEEAEVTTRPPRRSWWQRLLLGRRRRNAGRGQLTEPLLDAEGQQETEHVPVEPVTEEPTAEAAPPAAASHQEEEEAATSTHETAATPTHETATAAPVAAEQQGVETAASVAVPETPTDTATPPTAAE